MRRKGKPKKKKREEKREKRRKEQEKEERERWGSERKCGTVKWKKSKNK